VYLLLHITMAILGTKVTCPNLSSSNIMCTRS